MHHTVSRHRLWIALAIPFLLFFSLIAWSFSSPVAATPDEDFHLASTWCGLGEREGLCENPGDGTTARLIPAAIPPATCFAFHANESAACWDSDTTGMARVERANADGLYPRVFYAAMSVFASSNVSASVMAMRLANGAFAVGLLTAVFFALPRRIRPALVVSVAATSVPLGVFVLASINPSSWAILSAATVWVTLYGATQTDGRRRWLLSGLAVLGAVIGAGARADSAIYAAFGALLALILAGRPRREQLIPLLTGVAVVVVAFGFYLSASQGGAVVSGLTDGNAPLSTAQIVSNFLQVPSLWVGALGGWALGWIDTPLPAVVHVLTTAVFGGAIFIGLRRAEPRRVVAFSLGLASMWLVPFILLYQSRTVVGDLVQPRYILPLLLITVGVASLRNGAARAWSGPRLWLAGLSLTVAYTVALHINIQRYTTGLDRITLDPGTGAEWWWAFAPSPMTVWIVGTLAFATVFVLFQVLMLRRRPSDGVGSTPRVDGATTAPTAML